MDKNTIVRYSKSSQQVLELMQQAYENGKLEEAFEEIFANNEHDMVTIWKCREYISRLPESYWDTHKESLPFLVLLGAMRGDLQDCNRLISKMGKTPDKIDIKNCTKLDIVRMLVELILPNYSDEEFLKRVLFLANHFPESYGGLALTACRPSLMNGFRDFTNYCRYMESKKAVIERIVEKIYGSSGKGIYEAALAEWKYETGNTFDALILVAGTIPELEGADDIRCLFVATALQSRILLFNGQIKAAQKLLEKIEKRIYETGYEELEASVSALGCLYDCYVGNNADVENWLNDNAPDENGDFFTMDMFSYLVKIRCYIQTEQYIMAIVLAKKLLEVLKPSFRPHDVCECHLLLAIACLKAGDEKIAVKEFEEALSIAAEHEYIRLLADEGQITLDLLKIWHIKNKGVPDIIGKYDNKEIGQIKNIAFEIAGKFPYYLGTNNMDTIGLTRTEGIILQLMAKGLSNDAISMKLGKKVGTIKCHTARIYRKFNVENRQQAINYARKIGLVG